MKLKAALLCFLLLASAAITVILWPQDNRSPAPSSSLAAAPTPSETEPVQDFSPHYSTPRPTPFAPQDTTVSQPGPNPAPVAEPEATPEPLVPVAFAQPGPDIHLNPTELQVLQNMRQEFSDSMRRDGLNPNNPAYYERWKDLQADFDERFRSEFGDDAFNDYQNAALHSPALSH